MSVQSLHDRPTRSRSGRRARWLTVVVAVLVLAAACADDAATTSFDRGESSGDSGGDEDTGTVETEEPTDLPADDTESADEMSEAPSLSAGEADSDTLESARNAVDLSADATALANSAAQDDPVPSTTAAPQDPNNPADPTDPGLAVPADLTSLVIGRDIIYTSELEIRVDDVEAATTAALQSIGGIGLIFGQESTTEPAPRAVLTIKVRPENFSQALAALKAGVSGTIERETVSTDDVTERVVDLESRITAAESSVERIKALLDDARDLNTIRDLEEQLIERETVLEVLRGQLKTLQDQVALATITLTITQRSASELEAGLELTSWLGVSEDEACPGASELDIKANADAVLCVEVENTGDDVLTEIDIEVPTFNYRIDDLTVRDGTIEAIQPGDALTAIVVLEAEDGFVRRRDVRGGANIEVVVAAVPAGDPETVLNGDDVLFLSAETEDSLPGFGESLDSGWTAFTTVVGILLIALGILLPFLPFIALFVWLARRSYLKGLRGSYSAGLPDASLEG